LLHWLLIAFGVIYPQIGSVEGGAGSGTGRFHCVDGGLLVGLKGGNMRDTSRSLGRREAWQIS